MVDGSVPQHTDRQMGFRPALHDQGEQQQTDMPQPLARCMGACFVANGQRLERRTLSLLRGLGGAAAAVAAIQARLSVTIKAASSMSACGLHRRRAEGTR